MTDLIDRADSGEIFPPSVWDTEVLPAPEDLTRDLTHSTANLRRPAAHPELEHDTGELPLTGPTGAERAVAARAIPPRPSQPPQPTTPTGPINPAPAPPPPARHAATDDKPPPGTEPPKPAPTPSRVIDGMLGMPVLRPAVPPMVKPLGARGRRRRPAPLWAWAVGIYSAGFATGAAGLGGALLWAVTR